MHLEARILITGGAGFLGSHLAERLLGEGADVICVDNFYTGTRRNIEHLLDSKYFELMRHDVTFPLYVEVDEIYNLACPASPSGCARKSCRRRRRRSMAIPTCTRRRRTIGGTSIRSASAPVMTRAS